MVKKIAIVTGTRAEYGLLKPVIRLLMSSPGVETQIFVTGMHLSPEFGTTIREIEDDGIHVTERMEILLSSDSFVGMGKSMGLAMIGFTEVFARNKPYLVVLLGDRFEIFCAAASATVARVPIAHIHGGELTLGAIDDAFRHSISKMSCLHFTSTEEYRKRVIQMGESPETVHNVGSLGVEAIRTLNLWSRERLESDLGIRFRQHNILVTFHPVTLDNHPAREQLNNLFAALDGVPDAMVVFTKANADAQGRAINEMIDGYVALHGDRVSAYSSLGQTRYLSLMRQCSVVVGNSSSGIIEAPSIGVPTVNIGDRQKGRVRAESVIDCVAECAEILSSIVKALDLVRTDGSVLRNPYEGNNTAETIVQTIMKKIFQGFEQKTFHDVRID